MNYQPLFDHLSNEHGLTLHVSEMQEIVRIVEMMKKDNKAKKVRKIKNTTTTRQRIANHMRAAHSDTDRGKYEIAMRKMLQEGMSQELYQRLLRCEYSYKRCLLLMYYNNH